MDDLPPSEGEERAPFRAPGLRVDVPRREAALVRIVRAAWAPAREVAGEGARALEGVPGLLPRAKAPGHRADAGVAELHERAGGQRRAVAARAVENHLASALGHEVLDLHLEEAAGDPLGARDEALLILVALTDVDEHRRGARGLPEDLVPGLVDRHLVDRSLYLAEDVAEAGHVRKPPYRRTARRASDGGCTRSSRAPDKRRTSVLLTALAAILRAPVPSAPQPALLQAMQEARVSAGGRTHPLPQPFHVFATQNPIEQEGTYPLPEAQLDRFTLQIVVRYPDEEAERQIVALGVDAGPALVPVLSPAELTAHQALVRRIPVPASVIAHVVALLRATRPSEGACPPAVRELLQWGAGPRAGQQLVAAAQARAALDGRAAVTIADVRALAPPVLEHRLVRSFAAESRAVSVPEILARVLDAVTA